MERKQFISLWLPGHSLSSRGRNSIRSLKQKPWGTMLAGLIAGLFSDSHSATFLYSSGPLGWGIVPPTVDLALLYQLVIKKMPHRYAPISFQWRILQSFICSIFDETIYLHYSLMVCPLFYNLPLCVSSQLPIRLWCSTLCPVVPGIWKVDGFLILSFLFIAAVLAFFLPPSPPCNPTIHWP